MKKTGVIKRTRFDEGFDIVNASLMILLTLVIAYPLYFTIIASISDPYSVVNGKVIWIPVDVTLEAYRNALQEKSIWIGYRNTLIYTALGTLWNLILTIPTAYVLSKKRMLGRNALSVFFLVVMYFSGGLIPTYIQVKSLGLINMWYTLVILDGISVYNVIVTRVFFQNTIPDTLYDAAQIDGTNEFQNFFLIALPLSKAILAVITLYYMVSRWNSYFTALLYVSKDKYQPLQIALRNVLLANQNAAAGISTESMDSDALLAMARRSYMAEGMKYALIFISSAPLLMAYPFVQKYFVQGVMIGSMKG